MTDFMRLWQLFRPYRGLIITGFIIALITLVANVTLLAISAWFITAMAVAGSTGSAMNYFTPAGIIRASAIARTGGRYLERLITHDATLRQLAALRVWFYQQLEPLAPARLQAFHSGDLLSRIRADVDALDQFYVRVLIPTAVAFIAGIGFVLFTAWYQIQLALVLALLLISGGVLLPMFTRRLAIIPGQRLVTTEAALRQATIDGTQGLAELLVCGAADTHAAYLNQLSQQLIADQRRYSRIHGITHGGVSLHAHLALWAVLWLGLPMLQNGQILPPQLAMLALLALGSFEAIAPLPSAFAQLETTRAAARRLFSLADLAPAVIEPTTPAPLPATVSLQIQQLYFHYPDADQPALADVNLTLSPGQHVAIVGATGSGKTSLFNLLLKFWSPTSGAILLGGQSLAELASESVRQQIALVSQQTYLFNTTIAENLRLAAPNATLAELEDACKIAQIHDWIATLPDGYATWVGETGVRVSGGQARRIAIARALLKNAPLLLLDEPTEGLDAETERALMLALQQLMRGRTTILITHRPVALAAMDEVLVLEHGRIKTRGTHAELVRDVNYTRLLGLND
ncbi:thiol reductant ABC exporter subunit CydC [Thiospirillum jenense]|uniref:Thiol reductant ABC exporter subunit CydC n=1 Tax=Thiospirillum jenense TaxID=1653858 RepID=A0A839H7S7_9GAMM|nr:thiol reductant ABC exporter subunit CydC [Thiospirillum jenense]MBB1125605.1 thiol reductant ABC exporter subunit CydC [Thiospirillum jenense]